MKLALLQTGRPPGNLADQFGDYPSMFGEMLGPEFDIESFDAEGGELPAIRLNIAPISSPAHRPASTTRCPGSSRCRSSSVAPRTAN